jgi:transposase
MGTTAARESEGSTGETVLHMAMELSGKAWQLGFTIGAGQRPRRKKIAARDRTALAREIARARERFGLAARARVVSCYEAGRDGFWLHRMLCELGVDNVVVDSASIEVKRRARHAKSDRLDVEKLLAMLVRYHQGEAKVWSVVRVPTREQEDARHLHRERSELQQECRRGLNRIKGLLATHGVVLPRGRQLSPRLEALRLWDGSPLPPGVQARLQRQWERVQVLAQQLRVVEGEQRQQVRAAAQSAVPAPAMAKVLQLQRLRGIGPTGAWVLVLECFGWRQLQNRRQVGALLGLTGTPYNSGASAHEQGISKAGSARLRHLAVELAWLWLRYQPESELSRWYMRRFGAGGPRLRRIGIVALARKLMVTLWRYLETGVAPAGAQLKTSAAALAQAA